jgi:hypothetical protein
MKKEITEHQLLPAFYGVAYRDYRRNKIVCYPLLINLIVILWRKTVYWLRSPQGNPR